MAERIASYTLRRAKFRSTAFLLIFREVTTENRGYTNLLRKHLNWKN